MAVYSSWSSSLSTVVLGSSRTIYSPSWPLVESHPSTKSGTPTTQLLVDGPFLGLLAKCLCMCFGGTLCTLVNLSDFGLAVPGCFKKMLGLFDRVLLRL